MLRSHNQTTRILSVAAAAAVAVLIGAVAAPSAGAKTGRVVLASSTGHHRAVAPRVHPDTLQALWKNKRDDTGVNELSQNFETDFDSFDSQGADDFRVPLGHTWQISRVIAPGGYFNGPGGGGGPATSETVYFYKNHSGRPGALIAQYTDVGVDNQGSFVIGLGNQGLQLSSGHYWISVQANLDFETAGEWGWETVASQRAKAAVWRNPGDGFSTGCTAWTNLQACWGAGGEGPDFMFTLRGVEL